MELVVVLSDAGEAITADGISFAVEVTVAVISGVGDEATVGVISSVPEILSEPGASSKNPTSSAPNTRAMT